MLQFVPERDWNNDHSRGRIHMSEKSKDETPKEATPISRSEAVEMKTPTKLKPQKSPTACTTPVQSSPDYFQLKPFTILSFMQDLNKNKSQTSSPLPAAEAVVLSSVIKQSRDTLHQKSSFSAATMLRVRSGASAENVSMKSDRIRHHSSESDSSRCQKRQRRK
uniref:Uncharacterized protein n=1 Tax=Lotharella oceanica TaxID=641309 RepID=A0A7S2TVP2_9EUKA|mmetsp:Transcript_31772/g.59209  ORF Transcript_31772/g.59209 Transcript_31772/m.59209 type:complete len:164 (+) Transcript_31772:88-579(+)